MEEQSKTSYIQPRPQLPQNQMQPPPSVPAPMRGPYLFNALGQNLYQAFHRARLDQNLASQNKVQVDWIKYPTCLKAFIDLPGVSATTLDISVDNGFIIVKGDRALSYGNEAVAVYRERFSGPFQVRIPISANNVDTSSIRASLSDGVLTIEVTRFDSPPTKRIKISSSEDAISTKSTSSTTNSSTNMTVSKKNAIKEEPKTEVLKSEISKNDTKSTSSKTSSISSNVSGTKKTEDIKKTA